MLTRIFFGFIFFKYFFVASSMAGFVILCVNNFFWSYLENFSWKNNASSIYCGNFSFCYSLFSMVILGFFWGLHSGLILIFLQVKRLFLSEFYFESIWLMVAQLEGKFKLFWDSFTVSQFIELFEANWFSFFCLRIDGPI